VGEADGRGESGGGKLERPSEILEKDKRGAEMESVMCVLLGVSMGMINRVGG
jgi:non-canonical (house-cleaning) NTP pyrophosphatase